jgi:hypothetical protein
MGYLAIPPALGVLISALVELAKALGWINDGDGGRLSLVLGMLANTILTLVSQLGLVDLGSVEVVAIFEILGLVGEIILIIVGVFLSHSASFATHKLLKSTRVFPQHRKIRTS